MIRIRSIASLSAQGVHDSHTGAPNEVDFRWADGKPLTRWSEEYNLPVGRLNEEGEALLARYRNGFDPRGFDRAAQIAQAVGALAAPHFKENGTTMGVIFASSKGYGQAIRHPDHEGSLNVSTQAMAMHSSAASYVAQNLGITGSAIDMSVGCSSGMQALYQAYAFLESGIEDYMMVGASAAPITSFEADYYRTLNRQSEKSSGLYCMPFNTESGNTMVMAEGGVAMVLERLTKPQKSLATIAAIGIARENRIGSSLVSNSADAIGLAMERAILKSGIPRPDVIISHAVGLLDGDDAEILAMQKLFPSGLPTVVSPKWRIGHTFGASGLFGIELAIHLLKGGKYPTPYETDVPSEIRSTPQSVIINTKGPGGNAVSVVLTH